MTFCCTTPTYEVKETEEGYSVTISMKLCDNCMKEYQKNFGNALLNKIMEDLHEKDN